MLGAKVENVETYVGIKYCVQCAIKLSDLLEAEGFSNATGFISQP